MDGVCVNFMLIYLIHLPKLTFLPFEVVQVDDFDTESKFKFNQKQKKTSPNLTSVNSCI